MPRRKRASAPKPELEVDLLEEEDDFTSGEGPAAQARQLFHDLLCRWYWMALGITLGLVGGVYYLSKAPKIYVATATVLVKQAASNVVADGGENDELDLRYSDALNTLVEQAKQADLMTKVARDPEVRRLWRLIPEEVDWFPSWKSESDNPPRRLNVSDLDNQTLGAMIGGWAIVGVRRNTRLLDIQVSHPEPKCAMVLSNAIASNFIEKLGENRADGRGSATEILEEKSTDARQLLQETEGVLANYKQVLEFLADQKQKELVFRELDRRYLPKHPKWIKAKEALELSEKRFLAEFELIRRAPADQEYWEQSRGEWDRPNLDESSYISVARRLLIARSTVLQSEIESQREIYDDLLTRYREKLASSSVVEAEVEESNPAVLPTFPSSPSTMKVMLGGGMGGLFMGFAFAFLLVKLDTKIRSVEQLELLIDLPILATIRNTPPKLLDKVIAGKGDDQLTSPAIRNWDPRLVFRPGLSETIYAEMYRILRASITLLGDEKKRRVTLFSSALPGDGKTLVSSNFAFASASQGKRTVLVDLDLRKPAVHKVLGLKRSELGDGTSEILAGKTTWQEALVDCPGQENLSYLFSGAKAPNPGELLDSEGIDNLLSELREEFEVVVVDSAPLLAVPDTRLIIPHVDNFCLVIRAEQTPKGAIRKVVDFLDGDDLTPCGVVLNAYEEKTGRLGRKGYGYGGYGQYGRGYGYGGYGAYGSDDEE